MATAPSSLLRLEASSLRERAAASIRNGITTGEIRAGELYSVPTLAARLGVSATPVREAMLDLANEGLVEAVRNRGFRVVELVANRRLAELVARLRDQTRLYGLPDLLASGILETAAADHRAILDAILAGNRKAAEATMRRHLEETTRGVWTGGAP